MEILDFLKGYSQSYHNSTDFLASDSELAEIVLDQCRCISEDVRKYKSKPFSQSQIARLDGTQRFMHLDAYRHLTGMEGKAKGFDNSPHKRYLFYTMRYKKRQGFFATDITKVTMLRLPVGLHYAIGLVTDAGMINLFLTGHFFDRVALRKGLDTQRSETIYNVVLEYLQGFLVYDFGEKSENEVIIYTNEGLALGSGMSSIWTGGDKLKIEHSFMSPSTEKDVTIRWGLLKTFITNEMANSSQQLCAEGAQRVRLIEQRLIGHLSEDDYYGYSKRYLKRR